MIRNRRGATISASAPAGTVHRNIGRVLATCTSETALGSGFRLVISQAEAVSEMASPVSEQVVGDPHHGERRMGESAQAGMR